MSCVSVSLCIYVSAKLANTSLIPGALVHVSLATGEPRTTQTVKTYWVHSLKCTLVLTMHCQLFSLLAKPNPNSIQHLQGKVAKAHN